MNLISKKIDFLTKDNIPQDSLKALRSKFYKLYQKNRALEQKNKHKNFDDFPWIDSFYCIYNKLFYLESIFFSP
jgi:hypothetical protein